MTSVRWIGIAFVLAAMASRAAADPPCKPTARLKGERAIVIAVEPLLRARGIDVVAPTTSEDPAFVGGACRHVTADVAGGGTRITVWVTDADGRRAQRQTEDAEAAATAIESWARGDLVDPLLAARGTFEVGSFDAASVSTVASATVRSRPRYLVTGGGDVGLSGDGALWVGARAQGCGMIGAFCVGGALRYAIDLERTGDTMELGTARTALALAVTGERPIRRGSFVLSPGIGVGLISVTATRDEEGEFEQASAINARLTIAGAFDLADAWSIRAEGVAELAPFARTRLGEADGVDRQLAASPKVQTWFGISLAYGGS